MIFRDVIKALSSINDEETIYMVKPWTPDSEVILAVESVDGSVPVEAVDYKAEYFLEAFLAKEFIDGWVKNINYLPTVEQKCERLITYAENDA